MEQTSLLNLPVRSTQVYFYKAFKAALKDLLTDIQNNTSEVLLVHGVSGIGKSTLAECLAYFLALEGESSAYIKMHGGEDINSKVVADSLASQFNNGNWIIVDQCIMSSFKKQILWRSVLGRSSAGSNFQKPIIMFTSGHYAPSNWWVEKEEVQFKVISLRVDNETVDEMKKVHKLTKEVSSEELLKVSRTFGRVDECLMDISAYKKNKTVDSDYLEEIVYRQVDVKALDEKSVWLLWPEFPRKTEEEIDLKIEPTKWKIEPWKVVYLGLLVIREHDPRDERIKGIMSWLDIGGKDVGNEDDVYRTYEPGSYFYYFPHLDMLHELLVRALHVCTPKKLFDAYTDVYNLVGEHETRSNAQAVKGNLFQSLLQLLCNTKAYGGKREMGLFIVGKSASLHDVDEVYQISQVDDLGKKVEEVFKKQKDHNVWCELNVKGKVDFEGYDFAFLHCSKTTLEVQLLQVTVNAVKHPKEKMSSVLKALTDYCKERIQGGSRIMLTGYFIVPSEAHVPAKGTTSKFPVATFHLPPTLYF